MLSIEQIREALQDRNLSAVAEATGVNYHAIVRLVNNHSEPNYSTVRTIAEYLQQQAQIVIPAKD